MTWEVSFSILSFCLFILFMRFSRQEYWSGLPFPSPVDHSLSDLSTMTRLSWVLPQAWLSFFELDKAVVLVWLDWLVFCEYGFSMSALWCPLATPTILLGFFLPWVWGISSQLLQQSAAAAPYLGRGVSPHCCPSWPSKWDSFSRPSCAHAATAPWTWGWSSQPLPLASGVGHGVPPPSHCPYPRMRDSSSRPLPLTSNLGSSSPPFLCRCSLALWAAAPDLGLGVTPLGHHPASAPDLGCEVALLDTLSALVTAVQSPCRSRFSLCFKFLLTWDLLKNIYCIGLLVVMQSCCCCLRNYFSCFWYVFFLCIEFWVNYISPSNSDVVPVSPG